MAELGWKSSLWEVNGLRNWILRVFEGESISRLKSARKGKSWGGLKNGEPSMDLLRREVK